jgi:hypothetical protein
MFPRIDLLIAGPFVFCAALTLSGCAPSATQKESPSAPAAGGGGHDHAHAHPSEGPHHGDLVELGNEEYHAEVVHGDGGLITVYILDGSAKNAVPIEAAEVVFNVMHGDKPAQFKLPAMPEAADGPGKSSRFSVTNAELASSLDDEKSSAKLVVNIAGKQYTGKVEHHHDHDHGHDHK